MQIQHISSETKKLIARLNPIYNSFSEMTPSEQEFLTDIVRQYKPKKLLELGIASGSSSVLLLNAIKDIPDSHLTSIDYSTPYYRDKTKNSGFVVDEYPDLKQKWTLYTGGMASEFMEKVGGDIDFCFIDTMHSLPGEVIDFLLVLPYLKPNAVIVFHDTNLQTWGNWPQCTSNNMLVSAISGEKIVPETFENVFFHNTLKKDFQMYFPNITGIILDGTQNEKIWDIFNLLTQKWKYMLKSEDIKSVRMSLQKHYSDFYVQMFDNILNYQMNIAKNERTLQDIIKENKELIDRKLQDGVQIYKTLSENQDNLKTGILSSLETTKQNIFQQIKEQNDSYISQLKQNENVLITNQNEKFSSIVTNFDDINNLLQKGKQQIKEAQQQLQSFQQDNFNCLNLNIQKLNNSIDVLNQELNNDIILSHQNIEMLEQQLVNMRQYLKQEYKGLSASVNELKLYVSIETIKKQYWYYKLLRWSLFPSKRKKYKKKYEEVKTLYKKVRKMKYDS